MKVKPKKVLKLAAKKGWLAWAAKNWVIIVVIVGVLLLIGLLIWWIRKRRKKQTAAPAEGPIQQPQLDLKRIWKAFLRGMPREYRRAVVLYQPYIVLGAAGSGKSALIDRCTDWRGQAAQFHPSHTSDPLLQIYHGTDAVVQELSVVVQADSSAQTRQALTKLWKPLRRCKQPRVVIVLDAPGLKSMPAEALTKHAQLIRGKINVLSRIINRPVQVALALTHMDQVEGYLELADLLQERGQTLTVDFGWQSELPDLTRCLDRYEDLLPVALTTRPAGEYIKLLSLLQEAPDLLVHLDAFVRTLCSLDPTTPTPELLSLSLTSIKDRDGVSANPMLAVITAEDVAQFRPLRRHGMIAAAASLAAVAYMTGSYLYERGGIDKATRMVNHLTASPAGLYGSVARRNLFDFLDQRSSSALNWVLPSFFADDDTFYKRQIYALYLNNLRQHVLYPRLRDATEDPDKKLQALYSLSLIYGSEKNGLGKRIATELPSWEEALDLPTALIQDYLKYNPFSVQLDLPYNQRAFERSFHMGQDRDYSSVPLFFEQLDRLQQEPLISRDELRKIRGKATALLDDVRHLDQKRRLKELLDLLDEEAGVRLAETWRRRISKLPAISPAEIGKLVAALQIKGLTFPSVKPMQFGQLMDAVKEIQAERDPLAMTQQFVVEGAHHFFSTQRWHELIQRSRVNEILDAFIKEKDEQYQEVFFSKRADFEGLAMGGGGGEAFFDGDGRVNGLFTRKAFEEQIQPVLEQMPAFIQSLPLPPKEKKGATAAAATEQAGEAEKAATDESKTAEVDTAENKGDEGTKEEDTAGNGGDGGGELKSGPALPPFRPSEAFIRALDEVREDFSKFVNQMVEDYATDYENEYKQYYKAFRYRARSKAALEFILSQIQQPSSPLKKFLADVYKNTNLELPEDNPFVEPMEKVPSTFAFLKNVMEKPTGGIAGLETYASLVGKLQSTISSTAPFMPTDDSDEANALKAKLDPLGRVALDMFLETDDSAMRGIEAWMMGANIRSEWQRPFLGPVQVAYRLGLLELNRTLADIWSDLHRTYLAPLARAFPFTPRAEQNAPAELLEAALHPNKAFFSAFRGYIAPVCLKRHDSWGRRLSRLAPVSLPEHMLDQVNALSEMGRRLWDEEGNPRPLSLLIKPLPLPPDRAGKYVVVLAYLQLGEASVYSFNQRPSWQELKVQWWKSESASVGAAYARIGKKKKSYRNLTVAESLWSLHHLLREASIEARRKNQWRWNLPTPQADDSTMSIQFLIKEDPWQEFWSLRRKLDRGGARLNAKL